MAGSASCAGMSVDFADYNNDGWPDLLVIELVNQGYALYKTNGDGSFRYCSFSSGVGRITTLPFRLGRARF
jgi:enediyne biosynthesis protein E4